MWLMLILAILIGYFLGNVNGAICVSKFRGDDVRTHGSGNAGLTNFIRSYGANHSLMVILIDGGKGVLAALVGGWLLQGHLGFQTGAAIGSAAVLLGHMLPVLYGFRGGKGILTGLFVALVVDWRVALLILAIFAVVYFTTRYVSLSSVLAAAGFAIGFLVFHSDNPVIVICGVFMGAMAIIMHHSNIVRLIKGQESKTDLFKKK